MQITFTPNSRFDPLVLSKRGDTLTVNGEDFDFSPLPDGYGVPVVSTWIIGNVVRISGELQITIACTGITDNVVTHPEDGDIGVPNDE